MADLINKQSLIDNLREELHVIHDVAGVPRTYLPFIDALVKVIKNEPIVVLSDKPISFNGKTIGYMTEDGHRLWQDALLYANEPTAEVKIDG